MSNGESEEASVAMMVASPLTVAQAQQIMREAIKDRTYQLLPLGQEAAAYLRVKRKRLTAASYRDWESALDKLARYFPALQLEDFELCVFDPWEWRWTIQPGCEREGDIWLPMAVEIPRTDLPELIRRVGSSEDDE